MTSQRRAVLCEKLAGERAAREIANTLALALLRPTPPAALGQRMTASIGMVVAEHPDHEPHLCSPAPKTPWTRAEREAAGRS
jgi:hypothetical protein